MYLLDPGQVAFSRQFKSLLLSPVFDLAEAECETVAPVPRAQSQLLFLDESIEEPHVDEMEELREELDGEGSIHT